MLLGRLHVPELHIGEGEAVHGLRVLGIDLQGTAQNAGFLPTLFEINLLTCEDMQFGYVL
jgi:hypothetical protein